MGLEWILRMSRRACSLGSSMSEEQKRTLSFLLSGLHRANPQMMRRNSDLTDFTVQSAGAQQGRVKSVWSVGSHYHLDSVQRVKAVHLVQQLTGHTQNKINNYINNFFSPSIHCTYLAAIIADKSNNTCFKKLYICPALQI